MTNKTFMIVLLAFAFSAGCGTTPSPVATDVTRPPANRSVPTLAAKTNTEVGTGTESPITGVDVSHWQGAVDFAKIKAAGKSYVFVKATLGDTEFDANYTNNMKNARAAGLAAGSYHFYLTDDTPQAQFANYSSHVVLEPGDLPPVIDIEKLSHNTLPNLAADLKLFLNAVQEHYGLKPILYSGETFANEYLEEFAPYPLWIAEYNKDKRPVLPKGWTHWTFWQHAQNGTVEGVKGPVDLDRFYGNQQQFQALLLQPRKP